MVKNALFRMNWGMYEKDIIYMGGSVEYTGNIIVSSKRSCVEEAIIRLGGYQADVYMERFRDGTAVVYKFVKDGRSYNDDLYPSADEILHLYKGFGADDDKYLSYCFVRRIKQYLTFIMQIISILVFIYAFADMLIRLFTLGHLLIMILCIINVFLFGSFYKYFRMADIESHRNIFN